MNRRNNLLLPLLSVLALLQLQCATNVELEDVRSLRKSGDWSACRAQALTYLQQQPALLPLWPEFALATASLTRSQSMDTDEALPLLTEAALATGAMYRFKEESPPREWSEAGRMVAMELMRLMNTELGGMNSERRVALTAAQNELQQRLRTDKIEWKLDAAGDVQRAQSGARVHIRNVTVMTALLSNLPGYRDSGTISLLEQMGATKLEWMQALALDESFALPLTAAAQAAVHDAQLHAQGDLSEVGYLLPSTITDNGIFK